MDDTAPKPTEDSTAVPSPINDVRVAPAPAEPAAEISAEHRQPLIPEVQAAGDPSVNEPAPTPNDQTPPVPGPDATSPPTAAPEPTHDHHQHKSGGPIVAIIAAVLVAAGLAVITVYAYMKTVQKDEKPAASQTAGDTARNEKEETRAEIDQTAKDIDGTIKASEESDFPEAELSDQNLNL